MAGSSGDLGAWGRLVLLGLCCLSGARTAAPNPVRNLTVDSQTTSSITLTWEAPEGLNPQNYIYWVWWTGQENRNEITNTTDTNFTAKGLEPGSVYRFSVWVDEGGVNSSEETLNATTAPNPVQSLKAEPWTNSSIILSWAVPDGPDPQGYTYWVWWPGDGDKNETRNTKDTSYRVEGLQSASSYEFSVCAEKNGVFSSGRTVRGSTAPNPVRKLIVQAWTNSSITLSWEVPNGPALWDYNYWVKWTGGGDQPETQHTTNTSVTVDGLKPGSSYELSVWVESNGVNSSWSTCLAATAPNPVRKLSMQARNNSSITLSWEVPDGPDLLNYTYCVQWMDVETKTENTPTTSFTVKGLEPGTLYELFVWAEKNEVRGFGQGLNISTVPNAVTSFRIQDQNSSSITLSWTAPLGPEPAFYAYWVSWIQEGGVATRTQDTPWTSITLMEMEAGSLYTFTVSAEANGVLSDNKTLTGATAPSEVTALQKEMQTNSSITLRWKAPADPHSELYVYWVHWAGSGHPQRERDPQGHWDNQTGKTNKTWYVVESLEPGTLYNFSVWAERSNVVSSTQSLPASTEPDPVTITSCTSTSGGYGVFLTWSCPLGGYEAFELQLGGLQASKDRSFCGTEVLVSDLQPAQVYQATIRTVWHGLKAPPASVTCHTDSAGVIIGAIVGVLLFFILVGLLLFFLKKRYNKSQKKSAPRDLSFSFPGEILARDFAEHVRKNEKDSNCGFAEEYQQLYLEDQSHSQTVALASENRAKNRYGNVLPYDWSRVPLNPLGEEPGSDYINASFLPGLWSPREFIAAQGPLPQTVGDFWRLVWEQQSHTLVMLTNCMEFGRVKCEHYWPLDAQPCTHGYLQVTLQGEEVTEDWTIRDLKLWHTQEQKSLSVRQFHYVAWPDHGVPHSPDPLLAFWKMLRQWLDQTQGGGPPIVHCSAGVGRTGTLIALDVLLRQLQCEGFVAPFNYVKKMRESRPLMVQTEAQYVFLHQCILRFIQQWSLADAKATYENLLFESEGPPGEAELQGAEGPASSLRL